MPPSKAETQATVAFVIDQIASCCTRSCRSSPRSSGRRRRGEGAPRKLPAGDDALVCLTRWPDLAALKDAAAEAEIGFVVDLVSEIRSVRSEVNVPGRHADPARPGQRLGCDARDDRELAAADRAPRAPLRDRLRRRRRRRNRCRSSCAARSRRCRSPGIIDLAAERARLTKELAKLDQEIAVVDAKLGNPDFIARAPEEIVEENRERKAAAEARKLKIAEALARLS